MYCEDFNLIKKGTFWTYHYALLLLGFFCDSTVYLSDQSH